MSQEQSNSNFRQLREKYKVPIEQNLDPTDSIKLQHLLENLDLLELSFLSSARDISSQLNKLNLQITEEDIDWLLQLELFDTAEILEQVHFNSLKAKYDVLENDLPMEPFYRIFLRLEQSLRLDPIHVIQLQENKLLYPLSKVSIAYHTIEATFYEDEYKNTKDPWKLPSASSNWRKAGEPEKALEVAGCINLDKVESDLKGALLTTKGAAYRSLGRLEKAEKCIRQAINCQPERHEPYTLMGAICYDRGDYLEGDEWFLMARERGSKDIEDEIERVVRAIKDKYKQREVAQYLITKDSKRYAWAKVYLK